jgi:predicted dehydrogenase
MHQIALIGTGYWGANIAPSFEATGRAEIRWLCDLNPDNLAAVSKRRPQVRTSGSLEEVLADDAVEAVAISTPTTTHHAVASAALAAGKHVLCEKPLTADSADALDLINKAAAADRLLMVGHVFEYNSTIRTVKDMIDGGELGDIHYLHFERTNLGPVRTDVNALWDLASHDISIMCDFMGEAPADVTANGKSFLNPGVEDVAFATFSFAGGTKAHVHASWLNPRKVRQITIVGSRKMLVWDDLDMQAPIRVFDKRADAPHSPTSEGGFLGHKVRLFDAGIFIPNVPMNRPLQAECEHFLDCLEGKHAPRSAGESGLRVVAALEAATASMRNASAVTPIVIPGGKAG